jgi:hypothetical protein
MAAVLTDSTPNNFLLVPEPPGTPFAPFTALTDTDVLNATQTINITLTATGSTTAVGTLTDPSGTLTQVGNTITEPVMLAGLGDGTALLQRLVYTPPALTLGQSNQITMQVVATDPAASNTTTDTFDIDTAPLIQGAVANQPGNVGQIADPFGGVVLTDGDFQTASAMPGTMDTATITLDPSEMTNLTGAGLSAVPGNPGQYTLAAATPGNLQAELHGLAFDPTVNDDGKTIGMSLAVTDVAANLTTADNATSVLVPAAAPPSFTGPATPQMIASGSTINPFNGITVQDKETNPTENVTITVSDAAGTATDANGTFNPSTYFTKTGAGVYTSTNPMDPITLSNVLAALVFNPTPDMGRAGPISSKIQLTVTDVEDNQSAAATPIALMESQVPPEAPNIIGITPAQMIAPTVTPFFGATVVDDATGATDTVTITVAQNGHPTDAGGTFTQSATGTTVEETSTGVYTFAAPLTPAALTTALDGLKFMTAGTSDTTIQLAVTDPGESPPQTTPAQEITLSEHPGGGGPNPNNNAYACFDATTGQSTSATGVPYTGPASGITSEFILATPDNINVAALVPNAFIELDGGKGEDAINVSVKNGNNTLDATGGSNFLVGGTGNDTFFLDDLDSTTPIWSTLVNFHAGDNATIWGVTPADFSIAWVAGEGAPAYSGLTAQITAVGKPAEYLTLAGLTPADLSSGKLDVQFGKAGGTSYMEISHV